MRGNISTLYFKVIIKDFQIHVESKYSGLEFRNEKGKAYLAFNITMFFRTSRPVCRAPRAV